MHSTNDKMARFLLPATLGVCIATVALAAVGAIAAMTQDLPRVGDVIAFKAGVQQAGEEGTRLIVHRPDQYGCALDLAVLRTVGGSLVVESQIAGGGSSFRVHWAGPRTTADAGNCGESADLLLDRRELDILALGAGGYGIGQKRMPAFVNESGG